MAKGDIFRPDIFSEHIDNGDGTSTATIGAVPRNYLETDGKYYPCDLSILAEKNWEFEYAVKKNNFNAFFNDSTDITNFTLAGFELINSKGVARWINYKLFNAAPVSSVTNGNSIKYASVFPNVDLEYVVNTAVLKENIIVKSPVDSFSFTFSLKLDGVTLVQQADGSIDFIDIDTNEVLWRILAPYAYDSNSDPKKVLMTKGVSYSLGTVTYNGVEYQSITATLNDTKFLANAVYPIVIDPTSAFTTSVWNSYNYADGSIFQTGLNNMWVSNWYDTSDQYNIIDERWNTYMRLVTTSVKSYVASSVILKLHQLASGNGTGAYPIDFKAITADYGSAYCSTNTAKSSPQTITVPANFGGDVNLDITTLWNNNRGTGLYGIDMSANPTSWAVSASNNTEYVHDASLATITVTYDNTPPANPTGLSATKASNTQINLAWTNPTDSDFASCKVYRDGAYIATVTKPTASYSDTTVDATVNHTYRVTALDTPNGNESSGTSVNYVETTPPGNPTGVTASPASSTTVTVSWTNPGDADFASCKVYRDGSYVATVTKPTATYTDTTTVGVGHTYKVTAVDSNNNESSGTTTSYIGKYPHKMFGVQFLSEVFGILPSKVEGV